MLLTREAVQHAAYGGAFLGAGGGGSMQKGIATGEMALDVGEPRLVTLADLKPDDLIVTVSMVGAPAAKEQYVKPNDFAAVVRMLNDRLGGRIAGMISSENGGYATLNGWFQSAVTGIPVVDAACNGRAHPTGVMGSMGLDTRSDYWSVMAMCGGNPARNMKVQMVVEGSLGATDRLIRQAAVEAGGMVAVARNPVTADYVRQNGAPGAVSQALELGAIIQANRSRGGQGVAEALASHLGGRILAAGEVKNYDLQTTGGFDVGRLTVGEIDLTFWNEFMTADRAGERLSTFPDLISALDAETGLPVTTAEIETGRRVVMVAVPKGRMILGAGVRRPEQMKPVEAILGVEMARYYDEGVE
ncbi:MAG: DUF917 domain-containing protein [Bacillota bacterium]